MTIKRTTPAFYRGREDNDATRSAKTEGRYIKRVATSSPVKQCGFVRIKRTAPLVRCDGKMIGPRQIVKNSIRASIGRLGKQQSPRRERRGCGNCVRGPRDLPWASNRARARWVCTASPWARYVLGFYLARRRRANANAPGSTRRPQSQRRSSSFSFGATSQETPASASHFPLPSQFALA